MKVKEEVHITICDLAGEEVVTISPEGINIFSAYFEETSEALQIFEAVCDQLRKARGWQDKGANGYYIFRAKEGEE